jgi:hypothetical protein
MNCVISRANLLSGIFTPKMSLSVTVASSIDHASVRDVSLPCQPQQTTLKAFRIILQRLRHASA